MEILSLCGENSRLLQPGERPWQEAHNGDLPSKLLNIKASDYLICRTVSPNLIRVTLTLSRNRPVYWIIRRSICGKDLWHIVEPQNRGPWIVTADGKAVNSRSDRSRLNQPESGRVRISIARTVKNGTRAVSVDSMSTDSSDTQSFHRPALDVAEELVRQERQRHEARDAARREENTRKRNPETHTS